jgi:hypothetical protein
MLGSRRHNYVARVGMLLALAAVVAGIVGCIPPQHSLTVSSTEGGKVVSPGEGTFACYGGRGVILLAVSNTGYHFVNWTGDVCTVADVNAAATAIHMDCDCSIVANFEVGRWGT